jgi:hypothetical protein
MLALRELPPAPSAPPRALSLSADLLSRAGVVLEAPPAPPRGPSRWDKGMARLARAEAARANQAHGKAPPQAFDLLREIERRYQPSHALVADLSRAEAGKSREGQRWLGRYLGGFLEQRPGEGARPFAPDAAFRRALESAALDWAARVCVGFDEAGAPEVELEAPSGIAALDRLAREIVVQAADRRRAGLSHAVRACYKFSARLARVPPVPILACGFDAHWRPECVYPLKELASTRVELDGIELDVQADARK